MVIINDIFIFKNGCFFNQQNSKWLLLASQNSKWLLLASQIEELFINYSYVLILDISASPFKSIQPYWVEKV